MSRYAIVPADIAHAYDLFPDIRAHDNEEWVAASGARTLPLLVQCVDRPEALAYAIVDLVSVKTLVLFGASPSDDARVGLAWMVATNAAQRQAHQVQRLFWQGMELLHASYPVLDAWAYHKNTVHHAWMLRLGFTKTGDRARLGMGFDFLKFTRTKGYEPNQDEPRHRKGEAH